MSSPLLTVPIVSLMLVAALDNADRQLLSSSFIALEHTLGADAATLGYLSLCTNLSYAFAVPAWGWGVHRYGIGKVHVLLSGACALWGASAFGIAASGRTLVQQACWRIVNGAALASILPLGQTVLGELVVPEMRGRAFGAMGVCEKVAGTLAAASAVYFDNWQYPYYVLGMFSIVMAGVVWKRLDMREIMPADRIGDGKKIFDPPPEMTMREIVQRIVRIPAFVWLVAQGIFGGTPWDMMSFVVLLLDWRGYTRPQIVTLQFTVGISGTLGSWLGGALGDAAAVRWRHRGRIYVALAGVALHVPTYGLFLYAPTFYWALLWHNLFYLTGTWSQAAAIRPLCAEMAQNPSERAQIVAMWMLAEKTAGAIFGAPLVGYLTAGMIAGAEAEGPSIGKAQSLAYSLFSLSALFWGISGACWTAMAFTFQMPPQQDTNTHDQDEELARVKLL